MPTVAMRKRPERKRPSVTKLATVHTNSTTPRRIESLNTDATCQTRHKGDANGARTDNGNVDFRRLVLWQRVTGQNHDATGRKSFR